MNPTNAPPSPPPSTSGNHLHSMETSSRFRNSDSRGEGYYKHPSNHGMSMSTAASLSSNKLRLLCSNGGHIVPRPHDRSLRYIGGETRMVVVDRHTTLPDLIYQLSKTLPRVSSSLKETSGKGYPFTLKYQLPSEDLDSLISLTTDEDLENMIDEYERLNPSSRIRLFVFPTNPESISSISFLENSIKSEDWFVSMLNGMNSGYSDTSSFNCLLNLDDDISPPEKNNVNQMGTDLKTNGSGLDVHSIPDSSMMETTSSFGSSSSTPSLVNLPAIRVNAGDRQKVIGGVEEQFTQMSVKQQYYKHQNDGGLVDSPALEVVSGSPVSFGKVTGEHSDPISSHIEISDQGLRMTYLKHQQQQQQQQFQLKQSMGSNLASPDSVLSDLPGNNDRAAGLNEIPDQHARVKMQPQIQNPACLLSMPTTQTDSPRNQLHNHQLQFIPPPRYIHRHPSGSVPVASYYQHPRMDQQNFVYYMPARQLPQGDNFPVQQPQPSYDAPPAATIPSDQTATSGYMTTNSGASQPVRGPYVGYSEIHQPSQLMYYATQAIPAHYKNMKSVSPFEASLQEQHVRSAIP